jgi:hypothetical protein
MYAIQGSLPKRAMPCTLYTTLTNNPLDGETFDGFHC